MKIRTCAQIAVALTICADASGAFVIDHRAFFSGIEHAFLDFESRGDGTPLNLAPLQVASIPRDEYASVGIRFATDFAWAHVGTPPDPNASLSNAVEATGSWPTVIGSFGSEWTIEFTAPVHAVGMGVVQIGFDEIGVPPSEDVTTTIRAFDAAGFLLGTVTLWADRVDGRFGALYEGGRYGDEWREFNYGFLGLATDKPIARLEFTNASQTLIDDLHVSAVPSPGAGAAFALLGFGALGRRRR